jgi:hypothetical protein
MNCQNYPASDHRRSPKEAIRGIDALCKNAIGYVLSAALSASKLSRMTLKLTDCLSADMTEISSPACGNLARKGPGNFDNGH